MEFPCSSFKELKSFRCCCIEYLPLTIYESWFSFLVRDLLLSFFAIDLMSLVCFFEYFGFSLAKLFPRAMDLN